MFYFYGVLTSCKKRKANEQFRKYSKKHKRTGKKGDCY